MKNELTKFSIYVERERERERENSYQTKGGNYYLISLIEREVEGI